MMTSKLFSELLAKWRKGTISVPEMEILQLALQSGEFQELTEDIFEGHLFANEFQHIQVNGKEKILERLKKSQQVNHAKHTHRVHFLKTAWFKYAAAIILIFGIGAYLWNTQKEKPLITNQPVPVKDILPGGNKALLTLADGSIIELDSAANGPLATQMGAEVIKSADGQLTYATIGVIDDAVVSYNTMSTPKGGQYQLRLPDGTQVWLNAASSITYPTAFTNKTREIKITGEAYFEVAKNKEKPFIVNIGGKPSVEVLGTRFNINSYEDEPVMSSTLLEGAIKVGSTILRPGQQAQAGTTNKIVINNNADLDKVMAWKNGEFNFEGADVKQAMRQISRWYDVEIGYEGEVPDIKFMGGVNRSAPLSTVLRALQKAGVSFTVKGKKIIVRNK